MLQGLGRCVGRGVVDGSSCVHSGDHSQGRFSVDLLAAGIALTGKVKPPQPLMVMLISVRTCSFEFCVSVSCVEIEVRIVWAGRKLKARSVLMSSSFNWVMLCWPVLLQGVVVQFSPNELAIPRCQEIHSACVKFRSVRSHLNMYRKIKSLLAMKCIR